MNLQKSFIERQKLTPYLFLLPAIALLGLTVFFPAIQAFALSFTQYEYDITQPPQWIGWENFQRLWQDEVFWQTIRNTALYLIGVVPILVVVPLGLAIIVNQKLRGINWFRTAFYTPVVISIVVAGIAWKALYTQNGLLNQFLKQFGLTEGIPWLSRSQPSHLECDASNYLERLGLLHGNLSCWFTVNLSRTL